MNTPEKLAELEHALTKLSTFRTSSTTSIVLMLFGVVVIVGAVVFSASRLRPLENQADELRTESDTLKAQNAELAQQSEQLRAELASSRQKLESLQKLVDLVRLAVIASQARHYEEADAMFDKAIALDPSNGNIYAYKGHAQYRAEKYAKAIQTLEACSKNDDKNVWCHYNLALAYWANGNHDQAIAQVRRTLDLDPSFRDTFKGDFQFNPFKASPEYQKLVYGE